MNHDPTSLEAELRNLRATPLDDELLARLECCAEGTWTEPTANELRFEEVLRCSVPARLDNDFMAKLESITRDVHFPLDEKIVLFPKGSTTQANRTRRPMLAAAAAVALIGAASALLVPTGEVAKGSQQATSTRSAPALQKPLAPLIPASFNRGLSAVHDEGVVWKSNTEPHRLVRVVYMDLITLTDENGRTFEVEQPRVEFMLVPDKTD